MTMLDLNLDMVFKGKNALVKISETEVINARILEVTRLRDSRYLETKSSDDQYSEPDDEIMRISIPIPVYCAKFVDLTNGSVFELTDIFGIGSTSWELIPEPRPSLSENIELKLIN